MLEYWNAGMMGFGKMEQRNMVFWKHYSIIPLFHYSVFKKRKTLYNSADFDNIIRSA
jgi:hypothetical protein